MCRHVRLVYYVAVLPVRILRTRLFSCEAEIELWNKLKGFNAPRHSELRSDMPMSLEAYRRHMGIRKPPPEPELVATEHELNHFYQELSTLTPERVQFLYRQRWERCRLEPRRLPSTLDLQYLEVTLKVLKGMEKRR